jgi:hypothetical protein
MKRMSVIYTTTTSSSSRELETGQLRMWFLGGSLW